MAWEFPEDVQYLLQDPSSSIGMIIVVQESDKATPCTFPIETFV